MNGINVLESGEYIEQWFDDPSLPDKLRDHLPNLAMKEIILNMVVDSLTYEELLAKCFCEQSDKLLFKNVLSGNKAERDRILKDWKEGKAI